MRAMELNCFPPSFTAAPHNTSFLMIHRATAVMIGPINTLQNCGRPGSRHLTHQGGTRTLGRHYLKRLLEPSVSGATIVRVSLIHLESLNRHHNSVGKFGFQPQDRWGFKVSPPALPATPLFNQEDIPINRVEESILLTPLDSSNRRQQFEN